MASFLQRLNYHTGLFLEQPEFILEQMYHLVMRQKLNYAMFRPGVLYGLGLSYVGGVLQITPGLAVDETTDATYGPIGRELMLMENLPVPLTGMAGTVWITIEYDHSLDEPKPPTSTPSRYTQKIKVATHSANPGPGTIQLLLGSIVIGTDATVPAEQQATLRLGGAPALTPTITGFAPTTGAAGTSVTITGTNFTGATAVRFGGVAAIAFTVDSATQITATVPAGAVTGAIRVVTPAGFGESATTFTVSVLASPPSITGFAPPSGSAGTVVTITGTRFTGTTAVRFGGVAATTFTVDSATQITATVPAGAVTGAIRVTTPNGSGDSASVFTVPSVAPAILRLSPSVAGSPLIGLQASGAALEIHGQNIRNPALAANGPATGTLIRFRKGAVTRDGINPLTRTNVLGNQVVRVTIPDRTGTPWAVNEEVTLELQFGGGTTTAAFRYDD